MAIATSAACTPGASLTARLTCIKRDRVGVAAASKLGPAQPSGRPSARGRVSGAGQQTGRQRRARSCARSGAAGTRPRPTAPGLPVSASATACSSGRPSPASARSSSDRDRLVVARGRTPSARARSPSQSRTVQPEQHGRPPAHRRARRRRPVSAPGREPSRCATADAGSSNSGLAPPGSRGRPAKVSPADRTPRDSDGQPGQFDRVRLRPGPARRRSGPVGTRPRSTPASARWAAAPRPRSTRPARPRREAPGRRRSERRPGSGPVDGTAQPGGRVVRSPSPPPAAPSPHFCRRLAGS